MHRFLITWLMLLLVATSSAHASAWQVRTDWAKAFDEAGVQGTLLVYDEQEGRWLVSDAERARHAYLPASTFKLFNALVALDTGAVQDEFDVLRWDGKIRTLSGKPYPVWNRDQTLGSAMRYSAVWFYQEMARRAGQERMQMWIDRAGYGNRDIGGGIDQFWLSGRLRISAEQQIGFMRALADGTLPFSQRAQEAVRRISIVESQPNYTLHAKTGLGEHAAQNGKDDIGWYIGWVESQGRRWFFAMNLDVRSSADADKRISLTRKLLTELGAFPAR